jgi:hypothetical protein
MKSGDSDVPRCECGRTLGCFFRDGRWWCADCLWAEFEHLHRAYKDLLELTEKLDKHPEGYDGPCLCRLCRSYNDG